MTKKLLVSAVLAKAMVSAYTRKDGTYVSSHDNGRAAAAPKPTSAARRSAAKPAQPASGGYGVTPFKHGGHQIKDSGGKHHVILQDKGVADRHVAALNHVAGAGKNSHMNEAIHTAARKHLRLDSFEEDGGGSEDFVDTGKAGLKAALHHAYDSGVGHSLGGKQRDAAVADAAKHFANFDSLEEVGHDQADFKEASKRSLELALKHAYASGASHAKKSRPAASKPAPAAPAASPATEKKWQVRDRSGNVVKVFHGENAEHQARQHVHANQGKGLSWRDVSP